MFSGINCFGIKLLAALSESREVHDVAVAPPVVYLPLVMLRSVAGGATRTGLSRALGTNEALTDEEREHRIRTLRRVLSSEQVSFDIDLESRGQRPFSPTFLRRAQELYGITVETDDTTLPLRLTTQLSVSLPLAGSVRCVQADRLLGLRFLDIYGKRSLSLLVPPRAGFWQAKHKPLQCLLERFDETMLLTWQERLTEAEAREVAANALPALPQVADSLDLLPRLQALDMGPALTPAADFSSMMVASEAPHLSTIRHKLQVPLTGVATSSEAPACLWWVTDNETGLVLALGARRAAME